MELALGPIFKHASYLTDCVAVSDPLDLTKALLYAFFAAGGVHLREKVVGFEQVDGKVHQIVTNAHVHPCDAILLATGAWSKPLAKMAMISRFHSLRDGRMRLKIKQKSSRWPISSQKRMDFVTTLEREFEDLPPTFWWTALNY